MKKTELMTIALLVSIETEEYEREIEAARSARRVLEIGNEAKGYLYGAQTVMRALFTEQKDEIGKWIVRYAQDIRTKMEKAFNAWNEEKMRHDKG